MNKVTKLLYVLLRAAVIAGCLAGLFYLFKNISYLLLHPQLFLGACPDCTLPSVYITFILYALLIVTGLFVGVFPPGRRGFFLLAVFGLLLGAFCFSDAISFLYNPGGYNYYDSRLYEYWAYMRADTRLFVLCMACMCAGWLMPWIQKHQSITLTCGPDVVCRNPEQRFLQKHKSGWLRKFPWLADEYSQTALVIAVGGSLWYLFFGVWGVFRYWRFGAVYAMFAVAAASCMTAFYNVRYPVRRLKPMLYFMFCWYMSFNIWMTFFREGGFSSYGVAGTVGMAAWLGGMWAVRLPRAWKWVAGIVLFLAGMYASWFVWTALELVY